MAGDCCGSGRAVLLEPICAQMEREGEALPIRVEKTAIGIRFQVAHGGIMLDVYDAIRSFKCKGRVARTVEYLQKHHAVFASLAARHAGETITLGAVSRLRT